MEVLTETFQEFYSDSLGLWSSVNLSLCPVLYFFSFLYYTDQVSTAMVLLTLCLQLSGQPWLSGSVLPRGKVCLCSTITVPPPPPPPLPST